MEDQLKIVLIPKTKGNEVTNLELHFCVNNQDMNLDALNKQTKMFIFSCLTCAAEYFRKDIEPKNKYYGD